MIVFGQQGSQIAGAFGPGGAILGAVIAVGAAVGTAMVAAFSRGSQSSEDLLKELDDLTEGFDKVGEAARVVYLRETAKQIGDLEEQIKETSKALERQSEELRKLNNLEVEFETYVENSADGQNKLTVSTQDLAKAREDQQKKLEGLLKKQALLNGTQKEEDKDATRRLEDVTRYVERLKEQAATLGFNTLNLHAIKPRRWALTKSRRKRYCCQPSALTNTKPSRKPLNKPKRKPKNRLHKPQRTTPDAKARDAKLNRPRYKSYNAEATQGRAEQASIDQRAVQIAESLMSEEEQIRLSYERRSQIILDSTLLTGQQVNEAMAALELERQGKLKVIKDKSAAEDRERAAQTTTQLLAFEDVLMKGKSEKQKTAYRLAVNLASAEKRENATKIVSDSYAAAMGAYKALAGIPIIGPALGAGAAALILGAGVSFAARSLAGRALGGQVRDGESYVVGERGPEVLTMNGGGGRIIPNEKLRNGGGKTVNQQANITFQVNTVDADGFDELLNSRRGQIVNMVNAALYDQGKGAFA
jgi:SLT domain-containing protein/DNA-binding protein H-NS